MEKMSQLGFSHALGGWELGAIQVFFFQGEGEGEGRRWLPLRVFVVVAVAVAESVSRRVTSHLE